jgi:hypothetical protein
MSTLVRYTHHGFSGGRRHVHWKPDNFKGFCFIFAADIEQGGIKAACQNL